MFLIKPLFRMDPKGGSLEEVAAQRHRENEERVGSPENTGKRHKKERQSRDSNRDTIQNAKEKQEFWGIEGAHGSLFFKKHWTP